MKKKMYKLIASLAIVATLFTQVNVVSNAEEYTSEISFEAETEVDADAQVELTSETEDELDSEFIEIEMEDVYIDEDITYEEYIDTEDSVEVEEEILVEDNYSDEVETYAEDTFEEEGFVLFENSATSTYQDGDNVVVEEEQVKTGNLATIKLIKKMKYDISGYFYSLSPVGYKVSSPDGAKASVTKKGMLTVKKCGTIIITPVVKDGKKKVEVPTTTLTVKVIEPILEPVNLEAYYLGQAIPMGAALTNLTEIANMPTIEKAECYIKVPYVNPKVTMNKFNGTLVAKRPGAITVSYIFTNIQGKKVTYNTKMKVKVAKLNVSKEIKVRVGKSKDIKLLNIPANKSIKWSYSVVSADMGTPTKLEIIDKNKVKVTGAAPGVVTLKATVETQTYTTTIKVY